MSLFETIFYRPLLNILIFFYQFLTGKDLGLAILLLTFLIRLIFLPFSLKAKKSEKEISDFQREIEDLREKYKEDKEAQMKAIVSLYQKKKINPFSSLFWTLIQLPILFALYKIFTQGLRMEEMTKLYDFVPKPAAINLLFLGVFDLSKPNLFFAFLAGLFQYFQANFPTKNPKDKLMKISNLIQKQVFFFLSIITFLFLLRFPSALSLYLIATSIFSLIFQIIINKRYG